jgi:hypothetical protein
MTGPPRKRSPAFHKGGARKTDLAWRLIVSDNIPNTAEVQSDFIRRRYRLAASSASIIAELAFANGVSR